MPTTEKNSLDFRPQIAHKSILSVRNGGRYSIPPTVKIGKLEFNPTRHYQDGFSNKAVNIFKRMRFAEIFRQNRLEIRQGKSMLAGFVKYLPSARMDCIIPRFTVSCSRCVASCDLLRFGWLSSDSVKCKGVSCVQDIEYAAQNRQKRKKPCAAFNTQHRAKVDLEQSK